VAGLLDPEKTEAIRLLPKSGEAIEPQFGHLGSGLMPFT